MDQSFSSPDRKKIKRVCDASDGLRESAKRRRELLLKREEAGDDAFFDYVTTRIRQVIDSSNSVDEMESAHVQVAKLSNRRSVMLSAAGFFVRRVSNDRFHIYLNDTHSLPDASESSVPGDAPFTPIKDRVFIVQ